MKSTRNIIIICLSLYSLYGINNVTVFGYVSFYDVDIDAQIPLVNVRVSLETQNPQVMIADVYTNNNGHYSFTFSGVEPEILGTRLYFSNSNIVMQGWDGIRNDYRNLIWPDYPTDPDCPIYLPCWFELNCSFQLDYTYTTGANNNYAKIFTMANIATDFAVQNGYNPPLAHIKYPASTSIVSDYNISDINASFFWPYETMDEDDIEAEIISCPCQYTLSFLVHLFALPLETIDWIFAFGGHEFQLTENTIYLKGNVATIGNYNTVFHEYGHFLHKNLRKGSWPISTCEYFCENENPIHNISEYQQSEKQAFIEGFSNFWASVVESYYDNPNNPFSGNYENNPEFMEYLDFHNGFNFYDVINGLNNEITVAGTFFDLYDPVIGSDTDFFQMTLLDIFNYIGEGDNTTLDVLQRINSTKTYDELAPIFYILDLNKIQHEMVNYSNFYKLEMHNRSPNNNDLGGFLVFEDVNNSINISVSSTGNQEIPVMFGSSYSFETNLLDHPIYNHLNWGVPQYYRFRMENYEIELNQSEIVAWFEQKSIINFNNFPSSSLEIQDPWHIREDGMQTGEDWIDIDGSYNVFPNQNPEFLPNNPIYRLRSDKFYVENNNIYEFSHWSSTGANFEDANSRETNVVFLEAGATVEPIYEAVNLIPNFIINIPEDEVLSIPEGANISFSDGITLQVSGTLTNTSIPYGEKSTLVLSNGAGIVKTETGSIILEDVEIISETGAFIELNYNELNNSLSRFKRTLFKNINISVDASASNVNNQFHATNFTKCTMAYSPIHFLVDDFSVHDIKIRNSILFESDISFFERDLDYDFSIRYSDI